MRKNSASGFISLILLIPILLGLVVGGAFTAKYFYDKINGPDRYIPSEDLDLTPPVHTGTSTQPTSAGTKALLPGAKWVAQTFNNCGPATTSMVLQYFGHTVSQEVTKSHLRTNPDDKNVFTYEMANYLRDKYGIESKLLFGGDIAMLKKLISNGFYVVVEDWLHPNEDIGHVTIIRGFDDEQQVLIADDSYIGTNITYPYEEFTKTQWKAFNYEYLPVYTPENEPLLRSIVGEIWDERTMYERALEKANKEISIDQYDMYAHFNRGTSLYALGQYEEAKRAFETSKSLGWPKRMLWYQIQPIQTLNELGEYERALQMADTALWGNDTFAEAHLEKAIAYKGLNQRDRATEEAQKALSFYPNYKKAQDFLSSL